jgi:hypothetical protein
MTTPPSIPNVGSQLDRAIVAYLISSGIAATGFPGDETCILPGFTWRETAYPNLKVHSMRSQHDPPMSGIQNYDVQLRATQTAITDANKTNQEGQRVVLDSVIGQALYWMLKTSNNNDLDLTAANITTAGRALAVSDPTNNGDMANFTCQHVHYMGDTRGDPNEDGAAWVEVRTFSIKCNPSNT